MEKRLKRLLKSIVFLGMVWLPSPSVLAVGQPDITFVMRNGINWITTKNQLAAYSIEPLRLVPSARCKRAATFIELDEVLKLCRQDFSACDEDSKELLRAEARNFAFGGTFDETGDVEAFAVVDWKIGLRNLHELNPDRLTDYARQLSIDPEKSVVARLDRQSLSLATDPNMFIFFKGHLEGRDESNSWFLQNKLEMLSPYEYHTTYLQRSVKGRDYVSLRSAFLNCDLAGKDQEYVDIAFDATVHGYFPVSAADSQIIRTSYGQLLAIEQGQSSDPMKKAILYGFQLGKAVSEVKSERLTIEYLINKMFVRDGQAVEVRKYSSDKALKAELTKANSYQERGSLVRLIHKPSEADM